MQKQTQEQTHEWHHWRYLARVLWGHRTLTNCIKWSTHCDGGIVLSVHYSPPTRISLQYKIEHSVWYEHQGDSHNVSRFTCDHAILDGKPIKIFVHLPLPSLVDKSRCKWLESYQPLWWIWAGNTFTFETLWLSLMGDSFDPRISWRSISGQSTRPRLHCIHTCNCRVGKLSTVSKVLQL